MFETEQQYTINGHDNEFGHRRKFTMYVMSPDEGITEETGVLLVVQTSNTTANKKYWQDLRKKWANKYNVVTIGLNYIGAGWITRAGSGEYTVPIELMDTLYALIPEEQRPTEKPDNPTILLEMLSGRDLTPYDVVLRENRDFNDWKDYHDYGFIQAIDCLWALGVLGQLCRQNDITLNWKRIYGYGIGDGGHIIQMCLRFAPNTFAVIVDNTGYPYVSVERMIESSLTRIPRTLESPQGGKIRVFVDFPGTYGLTEKATYYLTEDMVEIRDLRKYTIPFATKLIMFQDGEDEEKKKLYLMLKEAGRDVEFYEESQVIGDELMVSQFESVADRYMALDSPEMIQHEEDFDFALGTRITFETTNGKYILDYASGAPIIQFEGRTVALRLEEEPLTENGSEPSEGADGGNDEPMEDLDRSGEEQ